MSPPDLDIEARCPADGCRGRVRYLVRAGAPAPATCPRCGSLAALPSGVSFPQGRRLDVCPLCGGREFFSRKDFPQRLGLALVTLFALAASACYYFERIPETFAVLAALVAIDAGIYYFVGRVTVCYACRAEFRGLAYNPDHKDFDLATSEKYGRP